MECRKHSNRIPQLVALLPDLILPISYLSARSARRRHRNEPAGRPTDSPTLWKTWGKMGPPAGLNWQTLGRRPRLPEGTRWL